MSTIWGKTVAADAAEIAITSIEDKKGKRFEPETRKQMKSYFIGCLKGCYVRDDSNLGNTSIDMNIADQKFQKPIKKKA